MFLLLAIMLRRMSKGSDGNRLAKLTDMILCFITKFQCDLVLNDHRNNNEAICNEKINQNNLATKVMN